MRTHTRHRDTYLVLACAPPRADTNIGGLCSGGPLLRHPSAPTIATAAVRNLLGGDEMVSTSRTPDIYADAAYLVLTSPAKSATGNFYIDEEVLAEHGIADLDKYRMTPGDGPLTTDLFL